MIFVRAAVPRSEVIFENRKQVGPIRRPRCVSPLG
jgi:hypothetical protein